MRCAIEAMLEIGIIHFIPYAWCFNTVDMTIESDIFEGEPFLMLVQEDDWNGGPRKAVAAELTKLLINGAIKFIPYQDEFSKPTDG